MPAASMTPAQAELLRDVAVTIIESGYAVPPCAIQAKRQHVSRRDQIEVLSFDPRLGSTAWKSDLIIFVMATYDVKRHRATTMLNEARQMRRERDERVRIEA